MFWALLLQALPRKELPLLALLLRAHADAGDDDVDGDDGDDDDAGQCLLRRAMPPLGSMPASARGRVATHSRPPTHNKPLRMREGGVFAASLGQHQRTQGSCSMPV